MTSIQYYSVVWLGLPLLIGLAAVLFRKGIRLAEAISFSVLTLALLVIYFSLRPLQTPLMGEAATVQSNIGQGTPVLLEFQSPYCVSCVAARPIVDRIEKQYAGRLKVIRLNIQEPVGMALAPLYRFEYTPTFIFFDEKGAELWRSVGILDEAALTRAMDARP